VTSYLLASSSARVPSDMPHSTRIAGRLAEVGKRAIDFPHVETIAVEKLFVNAFELVEQRGLVGLGGRHLLVRVD
jgi:hypothetical protein